MIVAFAPGGGTDLAARILARFLERDLGQRGSPTEGMPSVGRPTVVVLNRPGAGGETGFAERARPGGLG